MARGTSSPSPVVVASSTLPTQLVIAGPPSFQRWIVDRLDVSHDLLAGATVIMPVAVYLNAVGPASLLAQSNQGAINRLAQGALTLMPGDNLIAVWQPTSGAVGLTCRASIEYELERS